MLLRPDQAAAFFAVERTYFDSEIRPRLPELDLARPGAKKPMPRFRREDCERLLDVLPRRNPTTP